MRLTRALGIVAAILLALPLPRSAFAADAVIRIGHQNNGPLLLLRQHGGLDERLKPLGYRVEWTEFPSGPPLLEALRAGAIDLGTTGEAPPIFAQAGRAPLVYVAAEPPSPKGEAILVPKDSPIRTLADLRGKRIALNKGSNVHYFLVKALEKAGIAYGDITPVFLAPADARAAFERGAVDAWVIWDPYLAAAQDATGARALADAEGIAPNVQFYLGRVPYADENRQAIAAVIDAIRDIDAWQDAHPQEAAAELATATRLPVPVIATTLARLTKGAGPITPEIARGQQAVADAFLDLHLIPKRVDVGSAVWKPGT